MARKSQRFSKIHLLAMAVVGAAVIAPAPASAAAAHAARAGHHASASSHRSAASRKTHTAKVVHHRTPADRTIAAPVATETQTSAPVASVAAASCADGALVPTGANLDLVRAATLCLINQQRAAAGLAMLRESAALDSAAQAHSADMVSGNYFDHTAPSGADPLSRVVAAGFATIANVLDLGENIAAGAGSLSTPAVTVADWMNSGPHRANILDPTFKQTGLGVAAGVPSMLGIGGSGATYTQTFGTAA